MFKKNKSVKKLVINRVMYAKYDADGDYIYLKVYKNLNPKLMSEGENEELIVHLIAVIENKDFIFVGYLNIK